MSDKKEKELINKLIELGKSPKQVFQARVIAVDETNKTVEVEDANGLTFYEVRLKSAINDNGEGIITIPEIESDVLVGLINNNEQALYVVMTDKVSKVTGKVGKSTFEITAEGVVINKKENEGEANGGILIAKEVVDELNLIKKDINSLKEQLGSKWIPVANDCGLALHTALSAWSPAALDAISTSDFTNSAILH